MIRLARGIDRAAGASAARGVAQRFATGKRRVQSRLTLTFDDREFLAGNHGFSSLDPGWRSRGLGRSDSRNEVSPTGRGPHASMVNAKIRVMLSAASFRRWVNRAHPG